MYDLLCSNSWGDASVPVETSRGGFPERHWSSLVRRFTTSVVVNLTYGQRVHRLDGFAKLHKIYDVIETVSRVAQPGNYLADTFPVLRLLPDMLAPWRREGRRMHEWEMELFGSLLKEGQAALEKCVILPGFVNQYLRSRADATTEVTSGNGTTEDGWMRDKLLAYVAGTILEAGSDTTASTIHSFVLFMLENEHVLHRAREEIDSVVGKDRLPTFEDEDKLPYLVACIKETMRRRPSVIMGVAHKAEEDDIYGGYLIPKGAAVMGNVWAIHMDPVRFPNPTAFDPDRFYWPDKPISWASGPDPRNRDHYAFGWGRRFCQGSYVAEASLFVAISRIVWGFNLCAPRNNVTGQPEVPNTMDEEASWMEGFISGPRKFNVTFEARSGKHAEIIQRAFDEAQMEWQAIGMKTDER